MCESTDQSVVLYVSDRDRQPTVDALEVSPGLAVCAARSADAGLSVLADRAVDCVVSVYELPETDGISFCKQVRTAVDSVPFVLFPVDGSESVAARAYRSEVTAYVPSSADRQELCDRVQAVIESSTESSETAPSQVDHGLPTRLALALDGTNTGVWEWNLATDELVWDERATQLAGFEPGDFPGTYEAFAERVHPDDLETIEVARQRAVETGSYEAEFRIVDGGTEHWIYTRAELFSEAGRQDRLVGVGWDITERKARQQELEATKAELEELATRLELALEETDSGVWQVDLQTRSAIWDDACYQLFGYDPDDSREVLELFTNRVIESDLQQVQQNMQQAIETGSDYQSDFRIELPGGEHRWIRSRGCVEYDDTGEPVRMLGVETDITDQKRAEQAVENTKQRYQRIFQLSEDYLVVVDDSGTITDVTPGVERMLGYSREDVIGTDAFDYIHPEDRTRLRKRFADVIDDPTTEIDVEYRLRTTDGSYCWVDARGNNHLNDTLLNGMVFNIRDISERKKREQKLTETTARLTQKNEQLERLAQIVSHDLQTPISTAEKLTTLLRADLDEIEPAVDQSVTDLEATHSRLKAFANRLPRLARESTDVEGPIECELRAIAEAAWQVVDTGPLELSVDSSRTLSADPQRLQRAFENLFKNTITHAVMTPQADAATVDGSVTTDADSASMVCVGTFDSGFYIADDGPGIDPEQQDQLFEYGMGTGSGSGFGLAIVRTIVEAHGWTVSVQNGPSGGARFEIDTDPPY